MPRPSVFLETITITGTHCQRYECSDSKFKSAKPNHCQYGIHFRLFCCDAALLPTIPNVVVNVIVSSQPFIRRLMDQAEIMWQCTDRDAFLAASARVICSALGASRLTC